MTIDLSVLCDYPFQLAKVTEALADAYFSNVLRDKIDIKPLSEAYEVAFRLCPNYRLILQGRPGFEKYNFLNKEMAEITSFPLTHPPT